MGMQKLGYNILRRLHARSYSSRAQVPAQVSARNPETFLPSERLAATVVLCALPSYGFLYLIDFGGIRTMYKYCNKAYRMELEERYREFVERRAEAERRDREAYEDLLRLA